MSNIQRRSAIAQVSRFGYINKNLNLSLVAFVIIGFLSYKVYISYSVKYEEEAQSALYAAERLHAANKGAAEFTKGFGLQGMPAVNIDTTQVEQKLERVIEDFSESRASLLGAILLANIQLEKNNITKAINILEKEHTNYSGHLVDNLLALKLSGVYELGGRCDKALPVLQKVYSSKMVELKPEALLRMALCEEALGHVDKAKQSYKKLASEFSETIQGKKASRYIEFLK